MTPRYYAQALLLLQTENPKNSASVLFEGLTATLKRRGHLSLLARIAVEFEKALSQKEKSEKVTLTIAEAESKTEAVTNAKRIVGEYDINEKKIEVAVDDGLLGGYTLTGPGFRYDASTKTRLHELYKQLTTSN